jgi:hypothetical protein
MCFARICPKVSQNISNLLADTARPTRTVSAPSPRTGASCSIASHRERAGVPQRVERRHKSIAASDPLSSLSRSATQMRVVLTLLTVAAGVIAAPAGYKPLPAPQCKLLARKNVRVRPEVYGFPPRPHLPYPSPLETPVLPPPFCRRLARASLARRWAPRSRPTLAATPTSRARARAPTR